MTKEEAATALDGNEYSNEGSKELFASMKAAGLVAVFGASDDLAELRGAIYDEADASTFHVDNFGLVVNKCDEGDRCPNWTPRGVAIEPIFDREGFTFIYETTIPHATFVINEDGETYCRGIVFSLAELDGPQVRP